MSTAPEQSRAAWRQLEHEWHRAQQGWRDSTTTYFAARFWSPLERETNDLLHELEALMKVLRQAEQAARAR